MRSSPKSSVEIGLTSGLLQRVTARNITEIALALAEPVRKTICRETTSAKFIPQRYLVFSNAVSAGLDTEEQRA